MSEHTKMKEVTVLYCFSRLMSLICIHSGFSYKVILSSLIIIIIIIISKDSVSTGFLSQPFK